MYTRTTITTESDMHGLTCPFCQDAACVTNIYLVNADGDGDMAHTCEGLDCIAAAVDRHHGDTDALVEISNAPMPWHTVATATGTVLEVAA